MRQILYLADGKKCIASACKNPTPCARRDAEYKPGMWLADFSVPSGAHFPDCLSPLWRQHIAHAAAVKPESKAQAKGWIGQ